MASGDHGETAAVRLYGGEVNQPVDEEVAELARTFGRPVDVSPPALSRHTASPSGKRHGKARRTAEP